MKGGQVGLVGYLRGFTLIELLVAMALVLAVTSVVATLAMPMRRAFDRGLSAGESAARARTALTTIVAAARDAGSGVVLGSTAAALDDVLPVVAALPASTIRITRAGGPQGLLRDRVDAGALALLIDPSKPCSEQDATCGIRARDIVVIFDGAKAEAVAIASVSTGSGMLHVASPLAQAFDPGAVVATIEQTTFTLRDGRLLRITAGGAAQPIADHIAAFTAAVDARRLDVRLRLNSATPGNAGIELHTSVALRK